MRVVNERVLVETGPAERPAEGTTGGEGTDRQEVGPTQGEPASFEWRGRRYAVTAVLKRWKETPLRAAPSSGRAAGLGRAARHAWWMSGGRQLYRVQTDAGMSCELALDIRSGSWLLTRVWPTTS